jgi:Uma2 family endonuclease
VIGAPELVVEVALSSASMDLRRKKELYLRSGVKEYLVWLVLDPAIHWRESNTGEFKPLAISLKNVIESRAFPGLRLDTGALLRGDQATVLE